MPAPFGILSESLQQIQMPFSVDQFGSAGNFQPTATCTADFGFLEPFPPEV